MPSAPVPKDAVAIESNSINYVFYVDDERYIKYYEGPPGGQEGVNSLYSIKSLKYDTKNIRVSKDVTQIAALAYKVGNQSEIRVYYAQDSEDGPFLKELCISGGNFSAAKQGALNNEQESDHVLAAGSSISAVNVLSSVLLKVFVTFASTPSKLQVWYFNIGGDAWHKKEIKLSN